MEDEEKAEETEKEEQPEKKEEKVVKKLPQFSKKDAQKKMTDLTEKVRTNPWILSTAVLGIIVIVFIVGSFSGGISGGVVSEGTAQDSLAGFIERQTRGMGEITDIESFNDNLYVATLLYQGDEIPLYMTKDGKYLVQGVTPLVQTAPSSSQEPSNNIVKTDVPIVELFVMTHCPYGTQAEKGMIPVMELLGDSVEANIRFVHYFMHEPEETETPIQVCIREEQPEKYLDYLECFLEDGDSDRCLAEVGVDESKMNECISNGNADDYYAEDSELSNRYGVQGSPTLVINGVRLASSSQSCSTSQQESGECIIYPVGRDSASYLDVVCEAFIDAPEECDLELSSASPSPGFGGGTGSDTSAQC